MNKIIILFVAIGLLIINGLGVSAIPRDITTDIKFEERINVGTISFLKIKIEDVDNDYVNVRIEDVNSNFINPGQPVLPKFVYVFELPFGACNVRIEAIPNTIKEFQIDKEICPAPVPIPLINDGYDIDVKSIKDMDVYTSKELFPSSWYDFNIGCGLDSYNRHVTHLTLHLFPVRYIPAEGKLFKAEDIDITITYERPKSNPFPLETTYDLVIISPSDFVDDLQRLVDHKNSFGVETILKTADEIYNEYNGVDKPEQIKYFIKDAIETWDIKYVLLVGGLKSIIFGTSRDDRNQGSKDWYVPVRYTNLFAGSGDDPGYISDLYYADIYKQGGVFDDWDSNGNGIFAEWDGFTKDTLDLYPDVSVGRLPCRNSYEVNTMIEKIIGYEQAPADPSWFNRIIVIAGDAFQDQQDLDFQWDISSIPDGEYTIHAQSNNEDNVYGPVDLINIVLDRSVESSISFTEDDHLKTDTYPYIPIAEITSPSEGDILGNSDVDFVPRGAYDGEYWARVTYIDNVMHIRGKSYDPQPYGVVTDIKVWITNSDDEIVFTDWRNDTEMYYEDEWATGERILEGRGGTLYYISDEFEKVKLWTSNGIWTGQNDVIDTFNQGSGFVHFEGHASPLSWGDQYPGIPGGRGHASVDGLKTFDPFSGPPIFPMSKLKNNEKLPIVVAGGCHNGQFNVTLLATLLNKPFMWTYGLPIPECWSWWLTRLSEGGSIATISNTGMGYGEPGKYIIAAGLSGWIDSEFFRVYMEENQRILGKTYSEAITNYINNFDMETQVDGIGHVKTIQQWTLLGDPSLKIGGYQ